MKWSIVVTINNKNTQFPCKTPVSYPSPGNRVSQLAPGRPSVGPTYRVNINRSFRSRLLFLLFF